MSLLYHIGHEIIRDGWLRRILNLGGRIQTILRAQVVEMAGVERGKLKVAKAIETLTSENVEEVFDPPIDVISSEELDATGQGDVIRNGNPTATDFQRRGPGRPKKITQIPGMRSKKHVTIEESTQNSAKRSRVSKGEAENIKPGAQADSSDPGVSGANNHNRPVTVKNLRSPATTPAPTNASTGLVFETRLTSSQKTKFIYATDTPSLSLFFKKVREKFQLRKENKIESIEVEIGSKVFVVDPKEERDWLAVIRAAEKNGDSGVSVVVGLSEEV